MALVRGDNTHWITKRPLVMDALLKRATSNDDKMQLTFAAAFLIAIGDPTGEMLAKLEK